jgi:hypothetical protein
MTRKAQLPNFQIARRDNYTAHFANRNYVKACPVELQMTYLTASQVIHKQPKLNDYGADSYTDEDWQMIINLANNRGLQAFYINPWYTSEEGWQDFQCQWQALPEEIEIKEIDMSWSTNRE